MSLEIRQEAPTPGALGEHGRICIAFVVDRILEVTLADGGLGGISLTETPVSDPYVTRIMTPSRERDWRAGPTTLTSRTGE